MPMIRASGRCLRRVRSAGVAIATSPTQFGSKTPIRTSSSLTKRSFAALAPAGGSYAAASIRQTAVCPQLGYKSFLPSGREIAEAQARGIFRHSYRANGELIGWSAARFVAASYRLAATYKDRLRWRNIE